MKKRPDKKRFSYAMSVVEQIEKLEDMNLIISDKAEAENFLRSVSYRRFTGYMSFMIGDDGKLKSGVTFDSLKDLYDFDTELKELLYREIGKIELSFRSRLAEFFSLKYGPLGYLNPDNLNTDRINRNDGGGKSFAVLVIDEMKSYINENARHLVACNPEYGSGDCMPSFCDAAEFLSLGTLSKFYKDMKTDDRTEFRDENYEEVKCSHLDSWLGCIGNVRNICAHYNRLYDRKLAAKPSIWYGRDSERRGEIANDRIFSAFLCMRRLLREDGDEFPDVLSALLSKHPGVDMGVMGFPADWEYILRNESIR